MVSTRITTRQLSDTCALAEPVTHHFQRYKVGGGPFQVRSSRQVGDSHVDRVLLAELETHMPLPLPFFGNISLYQTMLGTVFAQVGHAAATYGFLCCAI